MMLRRVLVPACFAALIFALPLPAANAQAVDPSAISEALHLPELIGVMQEEGLAYGNDLEGELFPDAGGAGWQSDVARIYDGETMHNRFDMVFREEMAARPEAIKAILAFYESERGQRIVSLEIEARRALLDESVEEAARVAVDDMRSRKDARLVRLREFAEANDLIEQNVTGALNSNLAFYRGLSEGGAFAGDEMTEADILAEVWAQEPDIRAETEDWLYPFLSLAYEPLSDADLQAYLEFSRTSAAKALNGALFAAFDEMFGAISHDLGRAAAEILSGQDI